MAYFFIYLLIIIVNIFAVLFVLKIRRNRLNDADVITDATLVEEDSIQQVRTKKSRSLFNKQDPSTNIFVEYEELEEAMDNPNSANRAKYETIRKQNLHKMEPIPVCKIPN